MLGGAIRKLRPPWRARAAGRGGASAVALSVPFLATVSISFLFILGVSVVVPVLPLVVETYGVSRAGGGMVLLSSFALGRLAFDFIAGVAGDRFGLRRVALVACALTLVASLVAATAPAYGVLLGARFAQGVGSALYMTVAMSHVITLAPEGHVGRLLAVYQAVILSGVSLGPAIGGLAAELWGLAGPFLLYAGIGALGAVVALAWLPARGAGRDEAAEGRPQARALVRGLLADPTFLLVLLGSFTLFAVRSGMGNTVLPLYAAERFAFSEAAIGVLLTSFAVGNFVVLAHAGRSVDRSGRRRQLHLSMWAMAALVAAYALIVNPWLLFVAAALLGAVRAYAAVVPITVVSDLAHPSIRGTAVGIQRTTTDLGLFAGPVAAGALADQLGYLATFLGVAAFIALVALGISRMRETRPDGAGAAR